MSMSADLHKAIVAAWAAAALDDVFTAYWPTGKDSQFYVLNDQEAAPAQPFPYVVFEVTAGSTDVRMSGTTVNRSQIRRIPVEFRVHTKQTSSKTAKTLATELADDVFKLFGGHPTTAPSGLDLDNGGHLVSQYQNDFGMQDGDQQYTWVIRYDFLVDVPVAA